MWSCNVACRGVAACRISRRSPFFDGATTFFIGCKSFLFSSKFPYSRLGDFLIQFNRHLRCLDPTFIPDSDYYTIYPIIPHPIIILYGAVISKQIWDLERIRRSSFRNFHLRAWGGGTSNKDPITFLLNFRVYQWDTEDYIVLNRSSWPFHSVWEIKRIQIQYCHYNLSALYYTPLSLITGEPEPSCQISSDK